MVLVASRTGGRPSQANKPCCEGQNRTSQKAVCQVPGCNADLAAEPKAYFRHRRICREHMQADDILCPTTGQRVRFCMQCGRLEPLEAFDGRKRSCRVSLQKRRKERRVESAPAVLTTHDPAYCHTAIAAAAVPAAGCDGFLPLYPAGPQLDQQAELMRQLSVVSTASSSPPVSMMDTCLPAGFAEELQCQLLLLQMEQQQQQIQQQHQLLQQQLCLVPGVSCAQEEAYCCNQQTPSPPAPAAAAAEDCNAAAVAAMMEGDDQTDCSDEAFEAMLMQMLHEELAASAAEHCTNGGIISRTTSSASSCCSSSNASTHSTAHDAHSMETLHLTPASPTVCCNTGGSMLAPPASLACSPVVLTAPVQMGLPAGAVAPMAGFCSAPPTGGLLAAPLGGMPAAAPLGSMIAAPAAAAQQAWAARYARLSCLKDSMEAVRQELVAVSRAVSAAEALHYQAQHMGFAAAHLTSQLM